MATIARAIFGCSGTELTPDERAFFADVRPWGFILFARNIADRQQARRLTDSMRAIREDAPILIDQEGGRVARLRPPEWEARPAARRFGLLYESAPEQAREAVYLNARLMAHDLAEIGVNVDCVPVLDVPVEGANEVIGDRAFSTDPDVIASLGRAVMNGTLAGGVLPVIKHVPGHGRAKADSHLSLPRIDAAEGELRAIDFRPFQALRDAPLAMTAHVLLPCYDEQRPASVSPVIMGEVIRGLIGLEGLVMSDDIGMKALGGPFADRARAVIEAGCDVALHCSGDFAEMVETASAVPPLAGLAAERFARALSFLHAPEPFDQVEAMALVSEAAGTPVA